MTDLVLGKGRLYFERFKPGTRKRSGEGFAYFGNTPELTVAQSSEKIEHFSSEGGLKVKDASIEVSTTSDGGFTTDHISPSNLALWYRGTKDNLTQIAATGLIDVWAKVVKGNYFQLGEAPGAIQGARKVKNVTVTKGTAAGTGTVTFTTGPAAVNDTVTVAGIPVTYKANPTQIDEIAPGVSFTTSAQAFKAWVLANTERLGVTASGGAGVITLTANAKGVAGNAITVAKSGANIAVGAATLAGGTSGAVTEDDNWAVNLATGLFRVKADADDIAEGDELEITYDTDAAALTTILSSNTALEGRLLFVSDNGYGQNKDHLWPYVQLSADGDYSLIGDEWQTIGFKYDVLKLDDETPAEIITDRG